MIQNRPILVRMSFPLGQQLKQKKSSLNCKICSIIQIILKLNNWKEQTSDLDLKFNRNKQLYICFLSVSLDVEDE